MNNPTRAQMRQLANQTGPQLVSLIAPMQRAGREVRQNQIRWKNIVKEAAEELENCGLDDGQITSCLNPAQQLIDDDSFWQQQSDGLAMFLSGDSSTQFRLSFPVEQEVAIGKTFCIAQLLPATQQNHHFYIFAVSPNRVRLLQVENETVEDLRPDSLPVNLQEALNIDEYMSTLQFHTTSRAGENGQHSVMHHGQGGSDPDVKKQDELKKYFRKLDSALNQFLGAEGSPLIFAGVEYLFPIFTEACSYANLCESAITGNPDELSPEQLMEKATLLATTWTSNQDRHLIATYSEKAYTDWASNDAGEILKAAKLGQIETVLLRADRIGPKRFVTGESTSRQAAELEATQLVNQIVVETLRSGGNAFSISKSQMPDGVEIAALFRSPAGSYIDAVASRQHS